MKYETNKSVAAKADRFAEREYVSDGYEREWLSKGYYHGYLEGQQQMIEKSLKWLEDNACEYASVYYEVGGYTSTEYDTNRMIEDFKKAMKRE